MQKLYLLLLLVLTAFSVVPSNGKKHGNGKKSEEEQVHGNGNGELLAKVDLPEDSNVKFYEVEPGLILIVADLKGQGEEEFKQKKAKKDEEEDATIAGDGERLLKQGGKKAKKDNAVKLYKRLTGKSNAPKALEDAQARADVVAENSAFDLEELPPDEEIVNDEGVDERRLRGRELENYWWIDNYCTRDNPPTYCRCYTERTTDTNSEIYNLVTEAEDIDTYLRAYSGGLYQNVYYWGCDSSCSRCCLWPFGCWDCSCWQVCQWKLFDSEYSHVTYGYTSHISSYNSRKWRWKFSTDYGAHDKWHYSVMADNIPGTTDSADAPYTCPYIY